MTLPGPAHSHNGGKRSQDLNYEGKPFKVSDQARISSTQPHAVLSFVSFIA